MEQLTGADASFLYAETPTLHMHTLKVAVVDPSTAPGGYSFERVREVLSERLHLLPPFRRRIIEIPWGLSHPVWIEDPDFDIGDHLRRITAPAPGGENELGAVVSEIAGTQLDRSRPLWEITVVEGLVDGNVGFVAKLHHAIADGAAAVWLLLNALPSDPLPPPPPEHPWKPERIPSRRTLVLLALRAIARNLLLFPVVVWRAILGRVAVSRRRKGGAVLPPLPFKTPVTSFNTALTPNRIFASATVRLSDMKAVRQAFECSVNDVFLAMCAGALRRYIRERGELPDRPLVTCIPVATDRGGGPRFWGNRVATINTVLPLSIAEPVRRLRAIREVTEASKEELEARGLEMYQMWTELTPPRPSAWAVSQVSRYQLADRVRPPVNLVTSNVPGPPAPLHVLGASMVSIHSVGPILEGVGLNVTAWSYIDSVNFGLLACPENMPDLWSLAGHLPAALEELVQAAREAGAGPAAPQALPEPSVSPVRTT
jgi:WS/DGAT/MGAT family acyltransferase